MAMDLHVRLANNMINPQYSPLTRRSQSVVKEKYIPFLDQGFDPHYSMRTYPMNSRGSLARIDSNSVEFFVNIPKLYDYMHKKSEDKGLASALAEHERSGGLSAIRDVYVEAFRLIGNRDYEVEWNHPSTRVRYEHLQSISVSYSDANVVLADNVREGILGILGSGNREDIVIMDAGVGNGGTTLPIISSLLDLKKYGIISESQFKRIKFILFDVDREKVDFLNKRIPIDIGFPKEGLIPAVGEFHSISDVLRNFLGKVSFFVSGAAICHVTNKELFFRGLHSVMRDDGDFYIWDPFQPLLFAPYVRCVDRSSNNYSRRVIVDQGTKDERHFILGRWDRLPEEILTLQRAGRQVKIVGEIPDEAALRFAGVDSYLYLPQLGYTGETVGDAAADGLVKKAYSRILEEIYTEDGHSFFEYIAWLTNESKSLFIPEDRRSPYQLIETVEDEQAYMAYLQNAGFSDIGFRFFFPAVDYRTADTKTASSSVTGFLKAIKK